jgi:SAM-dependent methyltransferase
MALRWEALDQKQMWDQWAPSYDGSFLGKIDPALAVHFIAATLPEGARILELGVGTGRVALGLASHGFAITGVDISPLMLSELRKKPGASAMDLVQGDMRQPPVSGKFEAVLLIHSALHQLLDQKDQQATINAAVNLLSPAGKLFVEAWVPNAYPLNELKDLIAIRQIHDGALDLSVSRHDPAAQTVFFQEISLSGAGSTLLPCAIRYVWPSELDQMVARAGLALESRSGSWSGGTFDRNASFHVSVYST